MKLTPASTLDLKRKQDFLLLFVNLCIKTLLKTNVIQNSDLISG